MSRTTRIVIEVAGGLIQQVLANGEAVEVAVVDYDADDVHPKDLIKCPALRGGDAPLETYAVTYEPEVDAERADKVFAAIAAAEPAYSADELNRLGEKLPNHTD